MMRTLQDDCQYADRPPEGYELRAFVGGVAQVGDMAYIGHIAGRWKPVRRGMNIVGADADELWYNGVMAIAKPRSHNAI